MEEHVDPSSILQLTGNKSVSFDNACHSFLEKGSWRDLIERDHIEDDDVTVVKMTKKTDLLLQERQFVWKKRNYCD